MWRDIRASSSGGRTFLAIVLTLAASACSGGKSTPTPPPSAGPRQDRDQWPHSGNTAARTIRDFLSFAPGVVPTEIADLAAGDTSDIAAYVASVRLSCFGYRLFCRTSDPSAAWGEVLSILCHDDAPLASTSLPEAATMPTLLEVLAHHPYLVACRSWPTGRSDAADETVVRTDVPLLLLHGELDPFSTPPDDAALATVSHAYAYVFTGQSTNPLGSGEAHRAREIRAAFVADPSSPPDTTCLGMLESPRFTP